MYVFVYMCVGAIYFQYYLSSLGTLRNVKNNKRGIAQRRYRMVYVCRIDGLYKYLSSIATYRRKRAR